MAGPEGVGHCRKACGQEELDAAGDLLAEPEPEPEPEDPEPDDPVPEDPEPEDPEPEDPEPDEESDEDEDEEEVEDSDFPALPPAPAPFSDPDERESVR
ncbi:hypothetical protein [Micromonospora sp. WMMD975]|uniref:hypothetical protein n=1 Tax=Micromonospora sp. WMMD975 TaxID=3016087 RepID=UPI00249ACDE5|nr:hypothetical protein [Micromonospora sp. WMMD975]WFE33606.1 hypothetical protein O7613_29510 [Micromonospora sp. WMMD975]